MYKAKLLEHGIPANINGFHYLNEALKIYVPVRMPMMRLYAEVGHKFGVSGSCVERAIRHALTHFNNSDGEVQLIPEHYTNSQFIAEFQLRWGREINDNGTINSEQQRYPARAAIS